jgi:hypothetical protein
MDSMARRTNRSALALTVRSLREQERLERADTALVTFATALAAKLDSMLDDGDKGYAIAAVSKVYFAALLALRDSEAPAPDAFEALLVELGGPQVPNGPSGW